jgi:hypothetical protein
MDPEERIIRERIFTEIINNLNSKETVLEVVRSIKRYDSVKKRILFDSPINGRFSDNVCVAVSRVLSMSGYSEHGLV